MQNNSKPELISLTDFLMIAPFYDLRSMFAPEIEYLKNGIEGLMQSGLIKKEENKLIEYRDSVAIIKIDGPLRPGRDWFFSTGYGDIQDAIVELIDKQQVRTIIQKIDSPGGTVKQAFETEEMFAELAKEKTLISLVTGAATSAAALMTFPASKRFLASKTAQTGSIGVLAEHIDNRIWYKEFFGEVRTSVAKGEFKDAGTDTRGYDEKAKIVFTEAVNKLYDVFAVAAEKGLGLSREEIDAMQSRIYIGQDGIDQGFADGFATLDQLVEANQNQSSSITFFTPGRPAISNIHTEETPMDKNELKIKHPDVFQAIVDEVTDGLRDSNETANAESESKGIILERGRISEIISLKLPDDYTNSAVKAGWSAEKTALEYLKAERKEGKQTTDDMVLDLNKNVQSDAPEIPELPEQEDEKAVTSDEQWEANEELRAEFGNDKARYDAFLKADEQGRAKILSKRG